MAKSINNVDLLAYAICLLSFVSLAHGFSVQGKVYCDTCRVGFETKISTPIEGAKMKLECKDRVNGSVIFSDGTETDENGYYYLKVDGDYEDDICEMLPVQSPQVDCNEIAKDKWGRTGARVSLTTNNGIASNLTEANPIGFMRKDRDIRCVEVLREISITSHGPA